MSLTPGLKLGPYEIVSLLGAGGMGEVYRAKDMRLGRDVAIKVLPAELAGDPERLARFRREAHVLASLNHPGIAAIHGLDEVEGKPFLVLELVEGETLEQRVTRGSIPVEEALHLAWQIAEAVEEAHEKGIVHRDLKPANVKLTKDGKVKVLDFGLAMVSERRAGMTDKEDPSESSTLSRPVSQPGRVLGTAAYMSPEQARGQPLDRRADIWSFGVVVYEMLTGKRPFRGPTTSDTLAAVLRAELDWSILPEDTPVAVARLLTRCLERELRQRLRDIGDARLELEAARAHVRGRPSSHGTTSPLARSRGATSRETHGRIKSLAVLPLENLSHDPAQDYFAEGMTEALITDLAQIEALRVISRTSAMRYKGSDKSIPEIARELRVDAIVEGSVLRAADQVRITAQLIDGETDTHVWARSYERDLRDILRLQGEVARAIAQEIRVKLKPQEQHRFAAGRSVDVGAHEAYLRGRHYWNMRTVPGFKKAVELFQESIDRDPTYSLGYAGLADCQVLLGGPAYGAEPARQVMPRAKAAAMKALEIDDGLAQARAALALVLCLYDWNFVAAEREFKQAIEHSPGYATAHQWYSICLSAMGRHDEAISEARHSLELDPMSLIIQCGLGFRFHVARQYAGAIQVYQQALKLDATFGVAHEYLARTYLQTGNYAEAVDASQRAIAGSGRTATNLMDLGSAYARLGDHAAARNVLRELHDEFDRRSLAGVQIAIVYGALGEVATAFEWVERALGERSGWMAFLAVDPMFDVIREDPRFQTLLQRMKD